MPYSVSSSFDYERQQYAPSGAQRKFLIGSSDYTDKVLKWPSFRTIWNEPKSQSATITLSNEDQSLNFFKDTPTTLRTECQVQVGFNGELITPFSGKINNVLYTRGRAQLRLVDKLDALGRRVIGSTAAPVEYTGSSYLPADIARWACVSYGGFSAVQSTSNPDIDWAAFDEWRLVFSASSVYVNAKIEGASCLEILRKIARMSNSAIYLKNNKLTFKRFSLADSNTLNLTPSIMTDNPSVMIDDDDTINRQHTFANYVPASRYWTIDAIATSSASVNSYGLREAVEKDTVIWYTNSVSALDMSQRIISVYDAPVAKVESETAMPAITHFVGEMVTITDDGAALQGQTFRIMEMNIDIDKSIVNLNGAAAQIFGGFTLDTSSLDGTDVLL